MKISASALLALVTILPMTNAWIFTTKNGQWDGTKSKACTKAPNKKGTTYDWSSRGCTIRIFSDSKCDNQIGIADRDWKNHELSRDMGAFKVNC
ncbi:hypothetical protein N7509_007892 [Penicillium cosmopolitanum]|uniref:Uncharacterized protein n=1 Tax=Penicillium cosmopolitanum TaxID=1131564 RepID=A0A9W9VZZ3_9EURO|nr:uncharacterized protein N7509_007892 [Penicillium cosmopolitanum]KAJ5392402.1 hypothetical protein N7509_007892 [Penicillium cosmopolitanum]